MDEKKHIPIDIFALNGLFDTSIDLKISDNICGLCYDFMLTSCYNTCSYKMKICKNCAIKFDTFILQQSCNLENKIGSCSDAFNREYSLLNI